MMMEKDIVSQEIIARPVDFVNRGGVVRGV